MQKFYFNLFLQKEVEHIYLNIRLRKTGAMNSLDLSFGQELKSSYSNKSFLLFSNMFRKNGKN